MPPAQQDQSRLQQGIGGWGGGGREVELLVTLAFPTLQYSGCLLLLFGVNKDTPKRRGQTGAADRLSPLVFQFQLVICSVTVRKPVRLQVALLKQQRQLHALLLSKATRDEITGGSAAN